MVGDAPRDLWSEGVVSGGGFGSFHGASHAFLGACGPGGLGTFLACFGEGVRGMSVYLPTGLPLADRPDDRYC